VVSKWEDVAEKTMKEPSVISAIQQLDYVADFKRGEEFKKGIVYEKNFFKELLDKAGVKPGPQK
jgi:tripartite-type tricarboxylate transporter receptor subunit TctC